MTFGLHFTDWLDSPSRRRPDSSSVNWTETMLPLTRSEWSPAIAPTPIATTISPPVAPAISPSHQVEVAAGATDRAFRQRHYGHGRSCCRNRGEQQPRQPDSKCNSRHKEASLGKRRLSRVRSRHGTGALSPIMQRPDPENAQNVIRAASNVGGQVPPMSCMNFAKALSISKEDDSDCGVAA